MKTGLPMPVKAVPGRIHPQQVPEGLQRIVTTARAHCQKIRILRNAPTIRILLMNHPVDRHHHAFAVGQDRVGIGPYLGRVVTQDVLGRIPPESVHPKLI